MRLQVWWSKKKKKKKKEARRKEEQQRRDLEAKQSFENPQETTFQSHVLKMNLGRGEEFDDHIRGRAGTGHEFEEMRARIPEFAKTFAKYAALPMPPNLVIVEYIWQGVKRTDIRSKCRTLRLEPGKSVQSLKDIPEWEFDGSSTGHTASMGPSGSFSALASADVVLRPIQYYKDPFRGGHNILVLCECLEGSSRTPIPSNTRAFARNILRQVRDHGVLCSVGQQYSLFSPCGTQLNAGIPLGWPLHGFPMQAHVNTAYGVGNSHQIGRWLSESHLRACLCAGIKIGVYLSAEHIEQWKYCLGPFDPLRLSDELMISRWILFRVAEDFGVGVSLDPKPYAETTFPLRCTVRFSCRAMRATPNKNDPHSQTVVAEAQTVRLADNRASPFQRSTPIRQNRQKDKKVKSPNEGYFRSTSAPNAQGLVAIMEAVKKLGRFHQEHFAVYGNSNENRLTSQHETMPIAKFSYGFGNRFASVNIPTHVLFLQSGYLEDRRPSANMDPYVVMAKLAHTILLRGVDNARISLERISSLSHTALGSLDLESDDFWEEHTDSRDTLPYRGTPTTPEQKAMFVCASR